MLSQVFNIAPPPSQGTRSESSNTKTTDAPDAFGSVLARQIDKHPATATNAQDGAKDSSKNSNTDTLSASEATTSQGTPPDVSSAVLALFGKQSVKTPVAKEKNTDSSADPANATGNPPLITGNPLVSALPIVSGNAEIKTISGTSAGIDTTILGSSALQKELSQSAGAREKPDPTTGKFAQTGAQAALTGEKLTADKPVLSAEKLAPLDPTLARKSEMTAEIKAVAEPLKMADTTAASAQILAQSTILQPGQPAGPGNTIAAPLNSRAWPEEFAQKISWIGTQQNQVAELHLNPPDLGPMSVVLSVTDNQATALFTSAHSAVRDAIENALPKLRDSLADNGIMLGNATVSDQSPRDSGNFTGHRPSVRTEIISSASVVEPTAITPTAIRRHIGMVDTFA